MRALFVTATGTEMGKTHVGAGLLEHLRSSGRGVRAIKPVMSGFDPNALEASDAGRLLLACGLPVDDTTLADVCLHRFDAPLAPNVAARRQGVVLDYAGLLAFTRQRLAQPAEFAVVEGAGGVMSPLTDRVLCCELIAELGLPTLVVTTSYLGAISHTLSALEVLQRRGVAVRAVVISQPAPDVGAPGPMLAELARFTPLPLLDAPFEPSRRERVRLGGRLASALLPED